MSDSTPEGTLLTCDICNEPILMARNVAGEVIPLNIDTEKRLVMTKGLDGVLYAVQRETWTKHTDCGSFTAMVDDLGRRGLA